MELVVGYESAVDMCGAMVACDGCVCLDSGFVGEEGQAMNILATIFFFALGCWAAYRIGYTEGEYKGAMEVLKEWDDVNSRIKNLIRGIEDTVKEKEEE